MTLLIFFTNKGEVIELEVRVVTSGEMQLAPVVTSGEMRLDPVVTSGEMRLEDEA